jgi:hypothetical protein
MMTKFWDKLSEGLAEGWNSRLLLPGVAFLALGLLAFIDSFGLSTLTLLMYGLDTTQGILLAVAGLLFIVLTGWAVQRLSLAVLRLFEGYWPRPFVRLSRVLANRNARMIAQKRLRRQDLGSRFDQLSGDERAEYNLLDAELPNFPKLDEHFLPTRLGNLLRAAEEYPNLRYGLEMSVVWPRLWLLLPETTREEISAARDALDTSTRRLVWSVLVAAWGMWAWWAPLLGMLGGFIFYWTMLSDAGIYAELLRAAFDLHRFDLYRSMRWELPADPESEQAYGEALTAYLHRGSAPQGLHFSS